MDTLKISLTHCYGIKKLEANLDFSTCHAIAIYAPNGSMKSSLAQTFDDVAHETSSKDRIFPSRNTVRSITDESNRPLSSDEIVVIKPYDEVFGHTEKTSTLLVNSQLRAEYEALHTEINQSKTSLLKALKEQSKSKKNLERELSLSFTRSDDQFFTALLRVHEEVSEQIDAPFSEVLYDQIYDHKVMEFLSKADSKDAIREYIEKYNELLEASTYFKKGVFNYYNAETCAKSLAQNGFFDASHSVNFNSEDSLEISSVDELTKLIEDEKQNITNDGELRKKFAAIEKQLNKNASLRGFHQYLLDNQDLLPHLANIENLREQIWKSYLRANFTLYDDLVGKYRNAEKRKREIESVAAEERTQWEEVVDIFNNRFFVPFTLIAKNRTAVVLGQEPLLQLSFDFSDGEEHVSIERNELLRVLSTGERKALYILNIIFEVEARKKARQGTLFVFDDIADSFDYKNKYAIIEYLQDISSENLFYELLLTHNFDFYRTVNSRFVGYTNCLMAFRSADEITLRQAEGIKNIFVNDWKPNFYSDNKKKIAAIPFIRNIVEYTKGEADDGYKKLTSALHWKAETQTMSLSDVDRSYNETFGTTGESPGPDMLFVSLVEACADECLTAVDSANFEHKIVLSIAIRIFAERFMVESISNDAFTESITTNQTARLFVKYRELNPNASSQLEVLQRVVLMTPETIHLNSFMYEPILDMSDEHLRKLYSDVKALSNGIAD